MNLWDIAQMLGAIGSVFVAPPVLAGIITTRMTNDFKQRHEKTLEDHKKALNEELEKAKLGFSKQLKDHENTLLYGLREHERKLEYRLSRAQEFAKRRYAVYDELEKAVEPFRFGSIDPAGRYWFQLMTEPDKFFPAVEAIENLKHRQGWMTTPTRAAYLAFANSVFNVLFKSRQYKEGHPRLIELAYSYWPEIAELMEVLIESIQNDLLREAAEFDDALAIHPPTPPASGSPAGAEAQKPEA